MCLLHGEVCNGTKGRGFQWNQRMQWNQRSGSGSQRINKEDYWFLKRDDQSIVTYQSFINATMDCKITIFYNRWCNFDIENRKSDFQKGPELINTFTRKTCDILHNYVYEKNIGISAIFHSGKSQKLQNETSYNVQYISEAIHISYIFQNNILFSEDQKYSVNTRMWQLPTDGSLYNH